jgi:hypothetical protein
MVYVDGSGERIDAGCTEACPEGIQGSRGDWKVARGYTLSCRQGLRGVKTRGEGNEGVFRMLIQKGAKEVLAIIADARTPPCYRADIEADVHNACSPR